MRILPLRSNKSLLRLFLCVFSQVRFTRLLVHQDLEKPVRNRNCEEIRRIVNSCCLFLPTALLNLVARLYTPSHGSITLDGVDISSMTREQFLSQLGVVEQQPRLFSRTLFENIAYGKLDASEAQMMQAARMVNLEELISKLPEVQ